MPAYCPHGRLLRSWQRQIDADFDDTYDARSRAMDDIDDALNAVLVTPFHAWLRVLDVFGGSNLRLSPEDVGYVTAGDTIGFFDNETKKLGVSTTTVVSISGNDVTMASVLGGLSVDDEIAVAWTHEAGGRTLTVVGPPREVQSRAVALARYYALGDITDLDEPPDTLADAYVAANEWLEERGAGRGSIKGATYRGTSAMSTRMEHAPAIDVDESGNWDEDQDLVDEIGLDRL